MTVRSFWRRFRRSEDAAAAIEFALLFPLLVVMLLGAVDLSRILQERMAIGAVLRAGAEAAFRNQTKAQIELAMLAASGLRIGVSNTPFILSSSADQVCACPATPSTFFACVERTSPSYPCGSSVPAFIYWRLNASKSVTTQFLPQVTFNKSLLVQVR